MRQFIYCALIILLLLACSNNNVQVSAFTISNMPTNCANNNAFWAPDQSVLDEYGYQYNEYLISGSARVFTYNNTASPQFVYNTGAITNYTLRIIVITPIDNKVFSGVATGEYFNPTANLEIPFTWHEIKEQVLLNRDIYVWMPLKSQPAAYLSTWNHCLYSSISEPSLGAYPDMTRDLGIKLRSSDSDNPLRKYFIKKLGLTTYSQSGGQEIDVLNNFYSQWKMPDGSLVYDGAFLPDPTTNGQQDPSGGDSKLNRYNDWRRKLDFNAIGSYAKVMRVRSEQLLAKELKNRVAVRQPESDSTNPFLPYNFRNYELAGAVHMNDFLMPQIASNCARDNVAADQFGLVAGICPPANCQLPDSTFPAEVFYKNAYQLWRDWMLHGTSPPFGSNDYIQLSGPIPDDSDTITPEPTIVRDPLTQNTVGGIRLSQIQVPVATYSITNPPLPGYTADWYGAALRGATTQLNNTVLGSLYGTHDNYVSQVAKWNEYLVSRRFILPTDALTSTLEASRSSILK